MGVMEGRKLFSLVGREYGCKGKEITEFLRNDPDVVTIYLKKGQDLQVKLESLFL